MMRDNDDNEALLPNEESSEMRATAPSLSQIVISGDGTENTDISEDVGLPWSVVEIRERLRLHQEAQPDRDDVDYLLSVIQNLVNPIIQPPASAVVVAVDDQNPGEVRKTTPCYSSVVDQSHLQLDADPAEAERIRIVAYLSYDTVYSDNFCLRCSHCPSNCECADPVYMASGWTPGDQLKALKVALFQEDHSRDSIHFNALRDALTRLKSKNRNPERDWYLGWNSAIACLINDIDARTKPTTQATSGLPSRTVPESQRPKTESSASSDVSEVEARAIMEQFYDVVGTQSEMQGAIASALRKAKESAFEEAAKIAENQWAMVSVGKVAIENQSEYERNAIATAIRDRVQQNNSDSEDLVE